MESLQLSECDVSRGKRYRELVEKFIVVGLEFRVFA